MENMDGKTAGVRNLLAGDHAVVGGAKTAALKVSGTPADRRPQNTSWDYLRVEGGDCLGGIAAGTGLWQRDYVPAADACLAGRRGVGSTAIQVDRTLGSGVQNLLVSGGSGLQQRACCSMGT